MTAISFTVYGIPKPQGSKRAFVNRKTGRAQMSEQHREAHASWRSTVTDAARKAIAEESRWDAFDGPVKLTVLFAFRRPQSHYRTGRNSHLLKTDAPPYPVSSAQGDLSKLIRAVEDSLTDAGIWLDDKQVAQFGYRTGKYWTDDTEMPYLDTPGAFIDIRSINYVEAFA